MRVQFIFGPALLVVGCWCLFVWQGNDEKRVLSGIQQTTMAREYREADKGGDAATVASEREEVKSKWDAVKVERRLNYLIGGAGSAGLGALFLLWGLTATSRAAHDRKERAHQREGSHHHHED